MDWHIFDLEFNRLGVIRSFEQVQIEYNLIGHDMLTFEVSARVEPDEFTDEDVYQEVREQIVELLFSEEARNQGRIICKSTDLVHGYLVRKEEYIDEYVLDGDTTPEVLRFTAFGLKYLMRSRSTATQQTFTGNIESAMRHFVNINCINPSRPNRIVPNLILGDIKGIDINVDAIFTSGFLDQALFEIGRPHGVGYDVIIDHINQKYVFIVYNGTNRTDLQSEVEPVIFSKKFGNVSRESFVDDRSSQKTTTVVVGEYLEEIDPLEVQVYNNDNLSGFNRWEMFIDAKDVQSIYTNDDDVDISMSIPQFEDALRAKGNEALSEYKRVQTFESEIADDSNYIFGIDYFLGDTIASKNDDLGVTMRRQIVQINETFTETSYTLTHAFGDAILEFSDVLKRELKYR